MSASQLGRAALLPMGEPCSLQPIQPFLVLANEGLFTAIAKNIQFAFMTI